MNTGNGRRTRDFGIDVDRTGAAEALPAAIGRRFSGRFPVDPFGLDPQLCDVVAPAISSFLPVRLDGSEHLPAIGPAALVANRGLGVVEPGALAVAVRETVQRRLRVVGAPNVVFLGTLLRRFGAVAASAEDVGSVLRAGHLVAVPLSPTWLRTGAGMPPLPLVQAMMPFPVIPVAVRAAGPFGTPLRWHVRIGAPVGVDRTYAAGDPLGAAELGETIRAAIHALLAGDDGTHDSAAEAV